MKNIWLFLIVLSISSLCYSQSAGKWKLSNIQYNRTYNTVQMPGQNIIVAGGGNKFNDAIRTVDVSPDNGQTWNYIVDIPRHGWLKSMTFVTPFTGFAAGDTGTFIRTTDGGNSWDSVTLPAPAARRDYNGIFFLNSDTGFLAGGWPTVDSMQTIIRTNDGGNTWTTQLDVAGPWLKGIYFISPTVGFAVGAGGTILKTLDGGASWNAINVPVGVAQRDFNSIKFSTDKIGIVAGGKSIAGGSYETILRTSDAGNSWTVIRDSLAFSINSVCFSDSVTAYAVGDSGTLLFSSDTGASWSSISLPDTINDHRNLYSVHFFNRYFGAAIGQTGKTLVYYTDSLPVPVLTIRPATFVSSVDFVLNGIVSTDNASSQIYFEYGNTLALGSLISATPFALSTSGNVPVTAQLHNLVPGTWYYYRIKLVDIYGSYYSAPDSFYSAFQMNEIPNWSFEHWTTSIADMVNSWYSLGNVQKVTSYDGSYAAKLTSYTADGMLYAASAVLNLLPANNPLALPGGTPFTARPDTLKAWLNYDISPGDSAYCLLGFKTGGNITTELFLAIGGNTNGNFVETSFPIHYQTNDIPDSIFLAFTNASPFGNQSANPTNVLMVDNISFTGTTQNVLNPGFEDWQTDTFILPQKWFCDQLVHGNGLPMECRRTTDSYAGSYALEIQNNLLYQTQGASVFAIRDANNSFVPTFPLFHKPHSLNGFFKYFPGGGDTLSIQFNTYYHDSMVSNGQFFCDTSVNRYTGFTMPITYNNMNGLIPDSASLSFSVGSHILHSNSRLIIDALSFDEFVDSSIVDTTSTSIQVVDGRQAQVRIFPNPASSLLNVTIDNYVDDNIEISILDLSGRLLDKFDFGTVKGFNTFSMDLERYTEGLYILTLKNGQSFSSAKFIKTH